MLTKTSMLPKICSKLQSHSKYFNCVKPFQQHCAYKAECYNKAVSLAHFHTNNPRFAKAFINNENSYLYNILPTQIYNLGTDKLIENTAINCVNDLYTILDKNWRAESTSSIVKCFLQIQDYCTKNDINISDTHFDKLVDGLMDHVEKLSNEEMTALLQSLGKFPRTDNYQTHNFHDVWSALDDICCHRLPSWDKDMLFRIADLWFKLDCAKLGDFVFIMLDKLTKNSKNMDVDDLVRCFFYFNVVRRKPIDFLYEVSVRDKLYAMTVDQMAIVALGFFKAKCRIKLPEIVNCMIATVIKNKETVNDITLCGILKVARFSANVKTADQIYSLLDALVGQIDRISWQCVLHTALLGTTLQIYHSEAMEKCCQRFLSEYAQGNTGRLKDVERMLLSVTMFNHNTQSGKAVIKTAFDDLHLDYRRIEIAQHSRCAISALMYCSMAGFYSNDLMNQFLNPDFIKEVFGSSRNISRDLVGLDTSIDIDCPDYPPEGARLGQKERHTAAKWQSEWAPNATRGKPNALETMQLNVAQYVAAILGGHDKCKWLHVLPHYSKADLIVCKHLPSNKFIRPPFNNYVFGNVTRAPKKDEESGDELKIYAIVVLGWNIVVRDSNIPLGQMEMKRRQLISTGYHPIFIFWKDFQGLSSENKTEYIKSLLN